MANITRTASEADGEYIGCLALCECELRHFAALVEGAPPAEKPRSLVLLVLLDVTPRVLDVTPSEHELRSIHTTSSSPTDAGD